MELALQLGNNYALQRDLLFYCTIPSPRLVLESRCVMALHRPCVGGSKTGKLKALYCNRTVCPAPTPRRWRRDSRSIASESKPTPTRVGVGQSLRDFAMSVAEQLLLHRPGSVEAFGPEVLFW